MSKLRLVRERSEQRNGNQDHPQDLRGFGNDPVITQSFPFANLTVSSSFDLKELHHFCAHFKLEPKVSALADGVFHVTHPNYKAGDHKIHSLRLFGASAALKTVKPNSRVLLSQISQLHHHMSNATQQSQRAHQYTPDGTAANWITTKFDFSLDISTQLTLIQAGIPIRKTDTGLLHLDAEGLKRCVSFLEQQVQAQLNIFALKAKAA